MDGKPSSTFVVPIYLSWNPEYTSDVKDPCFIYASTSVSWILQSQALRLGDHSIIEFPLHVYMWCPKIYMWNLSLYLWGTRPPILNSHCSGLPFGGPAYEEPQPILESSCSKIYFGDWRHNLMTSIPHSKIPDSIMVNPHLKLQTLCLSSKPCGFHNIYIYKSIYIADMP